MDQRTIRLAAMSGLGYVLFTGTAAAQMGGHGTGTGGTWWGMTGWMSLWPLLLLAVLGLVVFALVRTAGSDSSTEESDEQALETLRRRYARGEIDDEEFEERRLRLRG